MSIIGSVAIGLCYELKALYQPIPPLIMRKK